MTLPAIAVRDMVAYPSTLLNLYIGRAKSIAAVRTAEKAEGQRVVLITQLNPKVDDPAREDLFPVGTVGTLRQVLHLPDGTNKIFVDCESLCSIDEFKDDGTEITAGVTLIEDTPVKKEQEREYFAALSGQWLDVTDDREKATVSERIEGSKTLDELIREVLTYRRVPVAECMEVIRASSSVDRAVQALVVLSRAKELKDVRQRIDSLVKSQMEKNQREYYLNEQMKAIRRELGDGDGEDELSELGERIKSLKLPAKVEEAAHAELKRLRQMPPMSSEATVVRNYLDVLLDVPWTKTTRVSKDLAKAKTILEEDHYGLEKIKERILEYLAVQHRVNKVKSPILCFVGAPGVGKTSLGQSIARATGRKYVRMALGGVHDESEIRGHRRTYIGAMPGQIVKSMMRVGVKNPLFLLDEIDKVSSDYRGDPAAALLEVLDPEQNSAFQDNYLDLPYDLSDVMFVATSNSYNIPPALLDRMEVISLSGYTEDEKLHIAERHLIPKQMEANGITADEVEITSEAILSIVRYYTREAGVRGLERSIGKILRKVVLKNEQAAAEAAAKAGRKTRSRKKAPVVKTVVTPENLKDFLGVARYTIGQVAAAPRVGVVNGLAWSTVGGDILQIEAQTFPGKGAVQRTGSLGDVMKESVETARSVVRSRARDWGIDPERFYKTDLHVHYPEGATPKDGPSAGAATTTAIISAMTGVGVRADVAMTGEINLHGEVLEIGGLKEKILAAIRGGCKMVMIPQSNLRDLDEMPEGVVKSIDIVAVRTIDDVLKHALVEGLKPLEEEKAGGKEEAKAEKKAEKKTASRTSSKKKAAGAAKKPAAGKDEAEAPIPAKPASRRTRKTKAEA